MRISVSSKRENVCISLQPLRNINKRCITIANLIVFDTVAIDSQLCTGKKANMEIIEFKSSFPKTTPSPEFAILHEHVSSRILIYAHAISSTVR